MYLFLYLVNQPNGLFYHSFRWRTYMNMAYKLLLQTTRNSLPFGVDYKTHLKPMLASFPYVCEVLSEKFDAKKVLFHCNKIKHT